MNNELWKLSGFFALSATKTVLLNRSKLVEWIHERNIKHAWLAQSVNVSEKTLTRWLNGDVKRVRHSNLKKLADVLDCELSELVAVSEAEQYPSEKNRDILVNELYNDSLLYELIMSSKVRLAISLIKSTFHSMLPSAITASFYTKLGYAALIHRKQKTAKKYFDKAALKAESTDHSEVLFSVNLAFAIMYFIDCEYAKCYLYLQRCESDIEHAGQELAHYYNTLALYNLYKAEFERSIAFSELCIEACSPDSPSIEKALFLCTAHQLKGAAYLCLGDFERGLMACEDSLIIAKRSGYPRCIRLAQAYLGAALACNGKMPQALVFTEQCLNGADKDDVSMPTLVCAAMFVNYKAKNVEALRLLHDDLAMLCPSQSAPVQFGRVLMMRAKCFDQTEYIQAQQDVAACLSGMGLTMWKRFLA